MSNTDSFIDEVTEEVRKDRLYALLRRYGWIAALLILLIVGGAAFSEYRKAQQTRAAQDLGDAMLAALEQDDLESRTAALQEITAESPGSNAMLQFMKSAALANTGDVDAAVAGLNTVAQDGELPEIYRQIALFKSLLLQRDTMDSADLRLQFEALAQPGAPLRTLAEEQLALLDISEGQTDAAIERLQALMQDAEASGDLQLRASQVIVALGGTPVPTVGSQG